MRSFILYPFLAFLLLQSNVYSAPEKKALEVPIINIQRDLDGDGKADVAKIYLDEGVPFLKINSASPFAIDFVGPDYKVINFETQLINKSSPPLLLLHFKEGGTGTVEQYEKTTLYLFRWDGKQLHLVIKLPTFISKYDYKKEKQVITQVKYKFIDINKDEILDLVIDEKTDGVSKQKTYLWDPKQNKFSEPPQP